MINLNLKVKLNTFEMLFFTNRTLLSDSNVALQIFIENENFEDVIIISEVIRNIEKTNICLKKVVRIKQKEYRRNTLAKIYNQ
jgi:hypothetical protein